MNKSQRDLSGKATLLKVQQNPHFKTLQDAHKLARVPDTVSKSGKPLIGERDRWQRVIPVAAKLRLRSSKNDFCMYIGDGQVQDLHTKERHPSTTAWAQEKKQAKNLKGATAGPQDVAVMIQHKTTGDQMEIIVKTFDYFTLETLISAENGPPYKWVLALAEISEEGADVPEPMDISDEDADPLIRFLAGDPELAEIWKRENEERIFREEEDAAVTPPRKRKFTLPTKPARTSDYFTTADQMIPKVTVVDIPVAYHPFSLLGKPVNVTPDEERQNWRRIYGTKDSAKCILCGVCRINRTGPSSNMGHVNPRSRGGFGHKNWMFLFQCFECNQLGKRTENSFDQLIDGRADKVLLIAHILFELYCASEAHLDYTFAGLADFVEKVYGRYSPMVRGGIKNERVFQLLAQEDARHPMPREMRNPSLRARHNVEHHYYNLHRVAQTDMFGVGAQRARKKTLRRK